MRIRQFWVHLVGLTVGCGTDAGPAKGLSGDCFETTPIVEVGEGENEFVALAENDKVVIVHGPQGGWHITGAVRATGIGQIARIRYTIEHIETGIFVTDYSYNVAMVMEDDCTGTFTNMIGFITVSEMEGSDGLIPPDLLEDEALRITMEVDDFGERSVRQAVQVIGERDPIDVME